MAYEKRISLRAIARLCGVSPATVCRIANGSEDFSEKTRTLVLETMRKEGYFQTEETGKKAPSSTVAVLITDLSNEFFYSMLPYMNDYFAKKQICTAIYLIDEDAEKNAAVVRTLQANHTGGILVVGTTELDLENCGIPNVYVASFPLSLDSHRNTVRTDEFVGGQLAAAELLRKGCTSPIILNNRFIDPEISPRVQGFLYAFRQHGYDIPDERIYLADKSKSSFDSARDLVSYLVAKGVQFDSIFACSDWRAYGALVALQNIGIRVPDQVRIVGYDAIRLSRCCDPSITSIRQNVPMMADTACDMLWKLMCGEEVEEPCSLIPVDLQQGYTT